MKVGFLSVDQKASEAVVKFIRQLHATPKAVPDVALFESFPTNEGVLTISIKLERGAKQ